MRKIEFYLGIGYVGAEHREVITYKDGVSDDEIEEDFTAWVEGFIDAGWQEIGAEGDK